MKRFMIVFAISAVGISAPAVAAPIPVPVAQAELAPIIAATNSAPNYRYTNSVIDANATWNAAGQYRYAVPPNELSIYSDGAILQRITWPSAATRLKVIGPRYLNDPTLEWMSIGPTSRYAEELPTWGDVIASPASRWGYIQYVLRPSQTYADKTPVPGGLQYTLGDPLYEYVVSVDGSGRVTRIVTTRFDGAPVTDRTETWDYTPVPIERPASLPIETVRRAIQAATLNTTIGSIARKVAGNARRTRDSVREVQASVEEAVVIENAAGDGSEDEHIPRLVRLKQRAISGGARIFRKNPYTGTFHEWRVTMRGGVWRAYRTAP